LCIAKDSYLGCTMSTAAAVTIHAGNAYGNDGGSGGWDVNDTQLSGTTVSTDIDRDHWGDLMTNDYH